MTDIRRPRPEDPKMVLYDALLSADIDPDPGAAIERQEARGQQQMVHSDVLPVAGTLQGGTDDPRWAELGFVLGPILEDDKGTNGQPLFRQVTLPTGWKREGSGHAMHSYILDEQGRKRVGVFYKAAFYDRAANASIIAMAGLNGLWYADHEFKPQDGQSNLCGYRVTKQTEYGESERTCYHEEPFRWHHPEEVCVGDNAIR